MRKIVGQRENPDPQLKETIRSAELLLTGGCCPLKIPYNIRCRKCSFPDVVFFEETPETGEIWFEGPDKCCNCSSQFSDGDVLFEPLTQDAIKRMFGQY